MLIQLGAGMTKLNGAQQLSAALQAGGVTGPPSRMEWLSDPSHHLVG
jgi:hypothetical protein